jgi:hypothetical protein
LQYLFDKFSVHPLYANRGSLLNLKPPGNDISFTEPQVSKFLTRFCSKAMKAKVLRHVQEDNSYELDIVHTDAKKNLVNLREWTIEKSIAQEFVLLPGNIYPFCYTIETFDILEKRFPTFNERSLMNEKKIDYNLLLETNFLLNINSGDVMKPGVMTMLADPKFKDIREYHFGPAKKATGRLKNLEDSNNDTKNDDKQQ